MEEREFKVGTMLWTSFFFTGLVCLSKTDPKCNAYFFIWSFVLGRGERGRFMAECKGRGHGIREFCDKKKVFSFNDSLFENLSELEREFSCTAQ